MREGGKAMTRADLKKQAKDSLKGRWGEIIAMILVYELILSGISLMLNFIPIAGSIASLIITVPLSFGFIGQIIKFSRGEQVGICDYFKIGFDNFSKSWSIVGNTFLKLLPIIILFIVTIIGMFVICINKISGDIEEFLIWFFIMFAAYIAVFIVFCVQSYLYVIVNYIGNDNLQLSGKEVVMRSKEIMKGNRLKYFILNLSFIGWFLLSILTLGIGFLWLIPYMQVTEVKFYESLINNNEQSEIITNN